MYYCNYYPSSGKDISGQSIISVSVAVALVVSLHITYMYYTSAMLSIMG